MLLLLENGESFEGISVGAHCTGSGELVFNTSMTGYQEAITDPSYAGQVIVFTNPQIGNNGINAEDEESSNVWVSGLVMRQMSPIVSNWRAQTSLIEYLIKHRIPAISGIDTRYLTKILRERGTQQVSFIPLSHNGEPITAPPTSSVENWVQKVSTPYPYCWLEKDRFKNISKLAKKYTVVVYDFGIKYSILRYLTSLGCQVVVVPAQMPASAVLSQYCPDAIVLSNGPSDPTLCTAEIKNIQYLLTQDIPLLGICLGHQLLGLANDANIVKMKYGHHGANHPVIDIRSNRIFITSQNHNYALDEKTLPKNLIPTHRSLFDHSLQGIQVADKKALGFQWHAEGSPGPHDSLSYVFHEFFNFLD